ncbi:MAG: transketolase family protein [Candidatus Doudnabacteria bacterium]
MQNLNQEQKLNPKLGTQDIEQAATRDGFGTGLVELGAKDDNVVALTADLAESTRILPFAQKFPERFVELGVAEQNMIGVAAGMALAGKIPFAASYATFSPGRSWDQVRVSVCYSQANVKVVGAHTGVSVGPDGATHQALEDIAITRVLPNLVVVQPCDSIEAHKATLAIGIHKGPAYLRLTREKTPVITSESSPFVLGKANILKDGSDVAIIACGPLVYNALQAAVQLEEQGINAMVVNNHTIKPLDQKTIRAAAQKTGAIVTVEEHQIAGGMGSAVAEFLAQEHPVPIEFIGMPDSFGESGQPEELMAKYGMDVDSIIKAAKNAIKKASSKI